MAYLTIDKKVTITSKGSFVTLWLSEPKRDILQGVFTIPEYNDSTLFYILEVDLEELKSELQIDLTWENSPIEI